MKRRELKSLIISLALICTSNIFAGLNPEFILKPNIGFGTTYHSLQYSNINSSGLVLGSAGGGAGLELGLSLNPHKNIEGYGTIGYQQCLAMQYYVDDFSSDKTSFSIGRASILVGVNYKLKFNPEGRFGLKFGGGGSYNIPTSMKITELNYDYGKATFNPGIGFHAEIGVFLDGDKWGFGAGIRYRNLNLSLNKFTPSADFSSVNTEFSQNFPNSVRNLDAGGFDLSITLRRKIFSNSDK